MSDIFQLVLPQSTTALAKTPPPASHQATAVTKRKIIKQQASNPNQQLKLYNSIFKQGKNKICDKTGLQFTQSLNYSLQTFLYTSHNYWVLAIIDINGLIEDNGKFISQEASSKINQVGVVIKTFCENNPSKLKGFRCNSNDLIDIGIGDDTEDTQDTEDAKYYFPNDLFAMLIYCHPKLILGEKHISKLMKKIEQQTNKTVCIGVAKMNEWKSFDELSLVEE